MSQILLATNNKEIDAAIGGDAVYFREAVYEAVTRAGAKTVVLSAFLPGQAGLADVVYMLRRQDVRVVFLAGSMEVSDPLFGKLLQYGVYDIIFNPVEPVRIVDVLRNPMSFAQAASILALPGDSAPVFVAPQNRTTVQSEQLVTNVPTPAPAEKVKRTNGAIGTIVAVWSPAPTGKTFSAINLSFAAALTRKTALVDYTGAAHTWLNLPKGERGLYSSEPCKQTQSATNAGPDVYTFDPMYTQNGGPNPELLNELRRKYNLLIVDGALPSNAETLIVVADHDIHHLRLIQRALPSIITSDHQNTLLIVNNAARLPYPIKYKDELDRDAVAVIPYCPGTVAAILCGEPQILSDPLLKKTFERIAAVCATGKANIISLKRGKVS
ncbi:MAG: hypothetical protein DDT32_00437 [Syntrophomonadaceae bacterium]|nr:hypothetical protein [Bacillota bacterium]